VKKIFFLVTLLSLPIISSCSDWLSWSQQNIQASSSWVEIQETPLGQEETKEVKTQQAIQSKIEGIRKRLALKGLIIDWDSYYRDGKIALALTKYLKFYRENPEDELILEKIWDSYFSMHKYQSAYNYYSRIQDQNETLRDKTALSLIHEINFTNVTEIKVAQNTLTEILPDWQQKYYYLNSLECVLDFHACKVSFNEYFWPEEKSESNEIIEQSEITYTKLLAIKSAIENYRNFKLDQVYLKDAYIVASWYSNDMYNLASHMWENILSYKPWYRPILKIAAQSYFGLWDYEKSREILLKYQEIDDEDPAVNYMLGIIHTQLWDYLIANIYLSKALDLGSVESLDIRRQLIHNFYSLDNQSNVLKQFKEFIEKEVNYTENDLWLAVYYHILGWDYDTALSWAKLWIKRFTKNWWNFYAYQAWIMREQWDLEAANTILTEWNEIFPENPFILINLWYTALAKQEKWTAISNFKTVQRNFPNTEFALSAQQELDLLSQ